MDSFYRSKIKPTKAKIHSETLENAILEHERAKVLLPFSKSYNFLQQLLTDPNFNFNFLMTPDKTKILAPLHHFQNISWYESHIKPIGAVSANGFIRQLKYAPGFDVVLKSSMEDYTDSLVYEYLVGQCINYFSQFFPFFSYTYAACQYKNETWWERMRDAERGKILTESLGAYLDVMDMTDIKRNLNTIIRKGCANNKISCLLTQYIPISEDLIDYCKKFSNGNVFNPINKNELNKFTIIFHMAYVMLNSLKNYLTHYDLHAGNVALVKVPDGKTISINYYNDGKLILQYKTSIIPVIIDYGRCYVNCSELNSFDVMKTVCKNDPYSMKDGPCSDSCGNSKGYQWSSRYDKKTDTFPISDETSSYIDYTRKNISHDLRLLLYFSTKFNFSRVNHPLVKLFGRIIPTPSIYGFPETASQSDGVIRNVEDAVNQLATIIQTPEFNTGLEGIDEYGQLDIHTDLKQPFAFRQTAKTPPADPTIIKSRYDMMKNIQSIKQKMGR